MERLTVIVKSTWALVSEGHALPAPPIDLAREDLWRTGGGLEEAAETAPYLPGVAILLRGHAVAPSGHSATAMQVRLALYRHCWVLSKTLYVLGDRSHAAPNPRPFQRMPLVYERAYGGFHDANNPVGVGADPDDPALPNVIDPALPTRTAGFGPIARSWAPRKHLITPGTAPDPSQPALDAGFDFRYWNPAPADQQIDALTGDEWIVLEGMHPELPCFRSRLPSPRSLARLYWPGAPPHGYPIELVADTLSIDADRMTCSLLCRGNLLLPSGRVLAGMRVLAGVELPGQSLQWTIPEPTFAELPQRGSWNVEAMPPQRFPWFGIDTLDLPEGIPVAHVLPFASSSRSASPPGPVSSAPPSPRRGPSTVQFLLDQTVDDPLPFAPAASESHVEPPALVDLPAPAAPAPVDLPEWSAAAKTDLPASSAPPAATAEPETRGLRATVALRQSRGEPLHDLELAGVELDEVELRGASLEHRSFAGSSLVRCDFSGARLCGADLSGADLTESRFEGADLSGADLSRSTLDRAQLADANLTRANLSSAKGLDARFEGASLERADLRQARLLSARFDHANLAGISAGMADLSRSSLVKSDLRGANLRATRLRQANLALASVGGADLRDADLAGANVYGLELSGARTNGAILRDVVDQEPPALPGDVENVPSDD